jgi:integrase
MPRQKGYVGQRKRRGTLKWFARVQGDGQDKTRFADSEDEAKRLLAELLAESPPQAITTTTSDAPPLVYTEGAPLLFSALIDEFSRVRVQPAQYRNDRKVAGMRSARTVRIRLSVLREYLGHMTVTSITPSVIERFRLERLATPTQYKNADGTPKERAIASVNRELEMLRGVMLWAVGEGYIQRAPKVPITKAHETKRERVLSLTEEYRLLKACDTPDRKHILPVVIAAIDTGARQGELLAPRWSDITHNPRQGGITITLRATTTKTNKACVLPVSDRLMAALESLPDVTDRSKRVFTMTTFQKAWNAACRDAGIVGLRFHDLRATFITRLIENGMAVELVAKLSGHQDVSTLYAHYLRPKTDALGQARDILNRRR